MRPRFLGADVAVEVDALAARPSAMWDVADAASITFEARRVDVTFEVDDDAFGSRPAAVWAVEAAASVTFAARCADVAVEVDAVRLAAASTSTATWVGPCAMSRVCVVVIF